MDFYQVAVSWVTNPLLILVFAIVFATMILNYLSRRVFNSLAEKALKSPTVWDDALLNSVRKPVSWLIWVLGFSWAAELISAEAESGLAELIDPVRYVAVVGLFTLFLTRFFKECETGFILSGTDITTANAIGKLLRISVFITAALSVLQTLGVSVSGILAFGGVGGIAVGFAAKDLLANFFGGLMLYLDRPFTVGDWVRSPDREIEGTVESIGWRLTLIRTFDKRPLYIPNSVFATIAVENPSRMKNRRIKETFSIRYADAARVRTIVADVKAMLETHEDIDSNQTLIVNVIAFAPSSIDFFIYTFTKTTDWVTYHGVKEVILMEIYRIIESHGACLAFPTSTVQLEQIQPES